LLFVRRLIRALDIAKHMLRYGRSRFFVFGVVPALNAIALLLYGLGLATHGSGGSEKAVPLLIVLAGACLLAMCVATVRRGRDLGWKAAAWVWTAVAVAALWFAAVTAARLL
jgi:hypothetical protein